MTHAALAQLQLAIYGMAPNPGWAWRGNTSGVDWAHFVSGDESILVFEGSHNFQDWARDLFAFPNHCGTDGLGRVHEGFYIGMDQVYKVFSTWILVPDLVKPNITVIGHSLGADHAAIMAGLMTLSQAPPREVVLWGCSRPGFNVIADVLAKIPRLTSYRNAATQGHGHDLITDVPFHLPPLDDYVDAAPFTNVCVPPASNDSWGPFAWHHMEKYAAAMENK